MNKQEIERALEWAKAFLEHEKYTKATYEDTCGTGDMSGDERKELYEAMDSSISLFATITEALAHQLTNGWIPVSERLPEQRQHEGGESVEFNVMLLDGIVPTTGCINNEGIWGWMDWEDYKFIPIGVEALYWRPLPEPPKEVSQL